MRNQGWVPAAGAGARRPAPDCAGCLRPDSQRSSTQTSWAGGWSAAL